MFDRIALAEGFVTETHAQLKDTGMQPGRSPLSTRNLASLMACFSRISRKNISVSAVFLNKKSRKCRISVISGFNRCGKPEPCSVDFDDRLVKSEVLRFRPPNGSKFAFWIQL
jgi:hypothetical protein